MDEELPNLGERLLAGAQLAGRILTWLVLFLPIAVWCSVAILVSALAGRRSDGLEAKS
jgi:hypothetical protein